MVSLKAGIDLFGEPLELFKHHGLGGADGLADLDALEAGVAFLDALELLDDALGRAGEDAAVFDGILDGGQTGVGSDFRVADVADLLLGEAAGEAQGAEHLEVFLVVPGADAG